MKQNTTRISASQTMASELMKFKFCSRPNLEVLTENAKHLEKVISDTNELAEKVSSKVRILDLAKVISLIFLMFT